MFMSRNPHGHRGSGAIRIGIAGVAAAVASLALLSPASSSANGASPGSWQFVPAQSFTDAQSTTTGTAYQTAVRAPINADGSSTFTAKRGVIPVQFDLLSATTTTVTTTRTYDPPVWQSIWSDNGSNSDPTNDWSGAFFSPADSAPLTFNDVAILSATYAFTEGNCRGGSLRWTINVTHNGESQNVHVYYGTPNGPNQGCSAGDPAGSGSGLNLIELGVPERFEIQGFGAPVYTTYEAVAAIVGSDPVNWVGLILDSGWGGDQRANISDVTVNTSTFVPLTSEAMNPVTTTGDFAKTCDLPEASLQWAMDDGTAAATVNEALSVQPKDTNGIFRQVDCKYIYNLDVSTLRGTGTYNVYANIGGVNVPEPARFDLK